MFRALKPSKPKPVTSSRDDLNPRQQRFAAEYLIDLHVTKAYQRVYGGSDAVARAAGARLLANVNVAAAVAEGKRRQLASADLSAARVLEELRRLAFGDRVALMPCRTVADLQALPADLRALVAEFEVYDANIPGLKDGKTDRVRRVKPYPKGQALELLTKHFKLLHETIDADSVVELFARLDRGRELNAKRSREDG
jgi:phage terminase small subunit